MNMYPKLFDHFVGKKLVKNTWMRDSIFPHKNSTINSQIEFWCHTGVRICIQADQITALSRAYKLTNSWPECSSCCVDYCCNSAGVVCGIGFCLVPESHSDVTKVKHLSWALGICESIQCAKKKEYINTNFPSI